MATPLSNHYIHLLKQNTTDKAFVRKAFALLEADLREITLLALQDWLTLDIVSPDLFQSIGTLSQPAWGSWNGLLIALRKLRNKTLRTGDAATREKIAQAEGLQFLLDTLGKPIQDQSTLDWLPPFFKQLKQQKPKKNKLTLQVLLAAPIAVRNRIAHDSPSDPDYWQALAQAIQPMITWLATQDDIFQFCQNAPHHSLWFQATENGWLTYNGLNKNSVRYVSKQGVSNNNTETLSSILLALQQLMGKRDLQEQDFRKLLGKIAPEDQKGVLVGDYLVGKFVGKGSHGTVHKGIQLNTGRQVAIKFLNDHMSAEVKARFRQEAEFLAHLNHPHIVNVIAYTENIAWQAPNVYSLADEEWYQAFSQNKGKGVKTFIAMEWMGGNTLDYYYQQQKDKHKPADLAQITQWFIDAADALHYVHQSDIIHRDIKPSNLMITEQGVIKLMDFGIARRYEAVDATRLTTDLNTLLGSPAYMSPEQVKLVEAEEHISPASDVYGLAAVFYELYTQQRLYHHDHKNVTAATLTKIKTAGEKAPDEPTQCNNMIQWELNTILNGGLMHEVSDRFQTMQALKRDLLHYQKDEPIEYKQPSMTRKMQLGYRRNRPVVNSIALSLMILIGFTTWYLVNLQIERDRAEASAIAERKARQEAESLINFMNFELRDKLSPLGRLDLMETIHQRIYAYFVNLPADKESPSSLREKATGMKQHADTLAIKGDYKQALIIYQKAHLIYEAVAEQDFKNNLWQNDLAVSYISLGDVYKMNGDNDKALQAYLDAYLIRDFIIRREPNNTQWQKNMSMVYERLGDLYSARGELNQAKHAYQDSIKILNKLDDL